MKTIAIKGRIIPLLITGLCLIFLSSNSALAQNKQPKNIKTVKIEAKEVKQDNNPAKLTDDQKAKIKDLRVEHMKGIRTLKAQSEELRAHLKTLNLAEKPDNKAIFKTIDDLAANHAEMMKKMITFRQSVKALLTPEQLKAMELRGGMNRFMGIGNHKQMGRMQGNRNFGRGMMMQRRGMNQMGHFQGGQMNRMGQFQGGPGQMGQGGMRLQGKMMNPQGGQMMKQPQVQRRFEIIRDRKPLVKDTVVIK